MANRAGFDFADLALNGPAARSANGVSGAGTKIGTLSDSYDVSGGATAAIAQDLLPTNGVALLEEGSPGSTDEGQALAELNHRTAPGARLYFYTAYNSEQGVANGITALVNAGCNITVDDIVHIMHNASLLIRKELGFAEPHLVNKVLVVKTRVERIERWVASVLGGSFNDKIRPKEGDIAGPEASFAPLTSLHSPHQLMDLPLRHDTAATLKVLQLHRLVGEYLAYLDNKEARSVLMPYTRSGNPDPCVLDTTGSDHGAPTHPIVFTEGHPFLRPASPTRSIQQTSNASHSLPSARYRTRVVIFCRMPPHQPMRCGSNLLQSISMP